MLSEFVNKKKGRGAVNSTQARNDLSNYQTKITRQKLTKELSKSLSLFLFSLLLDLDIG